MNLVTHQLDRRTFTTETIKALFAGVATTITACSDDSSSPTAPSGGGGGGTSSGDVTGTISANHGHSAVITRAQ
jgi:hypothetical protein